MRRAVPCSTGLAIYEAVKRELELAGATPRPPTPPPKGPMTLDRATVLRFASLNEQRVADTRDWREEEELRRWFTDHRHLDKQHFVLLGRWKSPRQTQNYMSNEARVIEEKTRL